MTRPPFLASLMFARSSPATPEEFEIVPVSGDDCADLARLHAAGFSRPWPDDEIAALLARAAVFGFIARRVDGRRPAGGFVLARSMADEAEILTITVDPNHRRVGFGWRLMEAVFRHLGDSGGTRLFLEVGADNEPALALYRKLGFRTVSEHPACCRAPDGETAATGVVPNAGPALVMQLDLD